MVDDRGRFETLPDAAKTSESTTWFVDESVGSKKRTAVNKVCSHYLQEKGYWAILFRALLEGRPVKLSSLTRDAREQKDKEPSFRDGSLIDAVALQTLLSRY
jgi:hypothetical protein